MKWFVEFFVAPFLTSLIFYIVVVAFPRYKRSKAALKIFISLYRENKVIIARNLLSVLKITCPKNIGDIILNYGEMKKIITNSDLSIIRNSASQRFYFLNVSIFQSLEEINSTLFHLISFEFVQKNECLYKRSIKLIHSIGQFHNNFLTYYRNDDDLEYTKVFENYIFPFLFGDESNGGRKEDDLPNVLTCALKTYWFSRLIDRYVFQNSTAN